MHVNMPNYTDIKVQRIQAIRLPVSNANYSKNFFTQALGFEAVSDITVDGQNYSDSKSIAEAKIRIVILQLGSEVIKLMQYVNVEGKPIPRDSQSNDLWFQHLAIVVSDMDSAYAHLQSFPIEYISTEPQTIPLSNKASAGVRAFKFRERDGHNLELIWFPPDKGQDKWHYDTNRLFLGIDHSAITVANTEISLKFYRDFLGMHVESGSLNSGKTQANLDGLTKAEVRVTPLRTAQGGLGIEMLDYIVPGIGRPIPSDCSSCDIAAVQLELIVNDIEQIVDKLQKHGVELVTLKSVPLTDSKSSYRQEFLVKDPSGHLILLIAESV